MFRSYYQKYQLQFKRPSGTSRGVLTTKESYFIWLRDQDNENAIAIGECGLLKGLSFDDRADYETKLQATCSYLNQITSGKQIEELLLNLCDWPSLRFGVEMAYQDYLMGSKLQFYPSNSFLNGKPIPINGLIWMGDAQFMRQQIINKLEEGFTCLKLKIGAIDFETELELLKGIRREFSATEIEIRVDANGAFSLETALEKLSRLAEYDLHSIEQPIQPHQWQKMAELCEHNPLAIALDEELIGVIKQEEQEKLLQIIKPQYLIFKPSLLGGFMATQQWINLAQKYNIPWWITSALESNIGLNAIAQFTATTDNNLPQGLGTGQLYSNNITSPLQVKKGYLYYCPDLSWDLSCLKVDF